MTDAPTTPAPALPAAEPAPLHVERLALYDNVSRRGAELALKPARLPSAVSK